MFGSVVGRWNFLLGRSIFRGYVSFLDGTSLLKTICRNLRSSRCAEGYFFLGCLKKEVLNGSFWAVGFPSTVASQQIGNIRISNVTVGWMEPLTSPVECLVDSERQILKMSRGRGDVVVHSRDRGRLVEGHFLFSPGYSHYKDFSWFLHLGKKIARFFSTLWYWAFWGSLAPHPSQP